MTAKLPPLHEALEKLANTNPTVFDVHYVDEVRRIAKWALDALNAAEAALERAAIEYGPFNADDMQAYAAAVVRDALERAVDISEHWGHDTPSVIRALQKEYTNE